VTEKPTALIDAFEKGRDLVARARRIALVTHMRADGDAVGSVAALQNILRAQGRQADGILFERPGPKYAFMLEREPLLIWEQWQSRQALTASDLWIMVDTAAALQVEPLASHLASRTAPLLIIDHHRTYDITANVKIQDDPAAATALLILEWCEACNWPLSPTAAEMLFIGLATDTGWFRFANADARAFAAAARLAGQGIKCDQLHQRLFQTEPVERFALFAAVCSGMTLEAGDRLAVMEVTRELLSRVGAGPAMTEDLVNEPLRINSVRASVLLTEVDDRTVRVSFRAKDGGADVAAVARRFGGGGHSLASGARLSGTIADARRAVVAAMTQAIEGS